MSRRLDGGSSNGMPEAAPVSAGAGAGMSRRLDGGSSNGMPEAAPVLPAPGPA